MSLSGSENWLVEYGGSVVDKPELKQLLFVDWLKGGGGVQIDLGAGEPPPTCQCLPCPVSEGWVWVSWLYLPQTQVLGQKCGGRAQRHHDAGAAEVSVLIFIYFVDVFIVSTFLYILARGKEIVICKQSSQNKCNISVCLLLLKPQKPLPLPGVLQT